MTIHTHTDGPQPTGPPFPKLPILVRLQRIRSVLDCLGDALASDGAEYSPHIAERSHTCDLLRDELGVVWAELREQEEGARTS